MKQMQISIISILLLASACSTKWKNDFPEQNITEQEINQMQISLKDLNKLQQTINELEKNRVDIQNKLDKQKLETEKLEDLLAEKDEIISQKNERILVLEQNVKALKKSTSYNEYEMLKSTEEKYQLLQKQTESLLNEQGKLQKNIEQMKDQNMLLANDAKTWKTKYEDFEQNFNNRVKEEKHKLKSKYNEKLNKITEDLISGKTDECSGENFKKNQQVGKVIEILDGKITFRLNDEEFSSRLINGDKLFVVRNLAGNFVNVGTLEITSVSAFSVFGRAVADDIKAGMSIHAGDYLVIKN